MALTVKQEAFALAYVETGNASEAYRRSYNVGETASPEGVWVSASRVLAKANVSLRVMELQEAAAERTLVTIESITRELDEARDLVRKTEQPAAMTGAIMGKAKVNGLITDKKELGGPNGGDIPLSIGIRFE